MASSDELFGLYVKTLGKLKSGTKLSNSDYVHPSPVGSTKFDEDEMLAVSVASDDFSVKAPMRSKSEFASRLKALKA